MDLRQLRYFIRIAQLKSFNKAALALNVAQPALSRQIAALEASLGTRLFDRTGRGVVLTRAGEILLKRGADLISRIDALETEIKTLGSESMVSGTVTIGMPAMTSRLLSAALMAETLKRYPDISLIVQESYSNSLPNGLRSGELDLALLFGPQSDQSLNSTVIAIEELCLIGPEAKLRALDIRSAKDIVDLQLILPHRPHAVWSTLDNAGIRPKRFTEAITLSAIRWLLEQPEHGVVLHSPMIMLEELKAGQMRCLPLSNPNLSWTVSVSNLASKPMSDGVAAIQALIIEMARTAIDQGEWLVRPDASILLER